MTGAIEMRSPRLIARAGSFPVAGLVIWQVTMIEQLVVGSQGLLHFIRSPDRVGPPGP
jgi:hypothetical protein